MEQNKCFKKKKQSVNGYWRPSSASEIHNSMLGRCTLVPTQSQILEWFLEL